MHLQLFKSHWQLIFIGVLTQVGYQYPDYLLAIIWISLTSAIRITIIINKCYFIH